MRRNLFLSAVLVAFTVTAVLWWRERALLTVLDARVTALRLEHSELAARHAGRQKLRAQLLAPHALNALHAAAEESERLGREIAVRERAVQLASAPLAPGQPKPWRAWKNQGHATPRATVETALWAAAGGDTRAFAALLEFDPAAQESAAKLLAGLPARARVAYPDPETLIASVSIKNIPLTEAQIAWLQEVDVDHVHVGVVQRDPERTASPRIEPAPGIGDVAPPSIPDAETSKLTFLTLHRTDSGWQIVVPQAAIERAAQELGGP